MSTLTPLLAAVRPLRDVVHPGLVLVGYIFIAYWLLGTGFVYLNVCVWGRVRVRVLGAGGGWGGRLRSSTHPPSTSYLVAHYSTNTHLPGA